MQKFRESWRSTIAAALRELATEWAGAGAPAAIDPDAMVVETPPKPEMGDIAFPLFPFARALKKAPPLIAQEVVKRIGSLRAADSTGGVAAGEAAAAGPYVNVHLDKAAVTAEVLQAVAAGADLYGRSGALDGSRIMLEFSCPNTNKPLHIGHLRNDAIGESLSRILRAAGAELRKVNLINDRGVHICKSMLAYRIFGAGATPDSAGIKGDHFVGDYYVKYAQHAKEHPEADEEVRQMLRQWEDGDPAVRALWKTMNGWVIDGIEQTYRRTGVSFDKVYYESDLYTLGKKEVLDGLARGIFQKDPDGSVWVDLSARGMDREVLLRSDGTSLYLTQDIGTAVQRSRDWPFDRLIYVVGSEQRHHFKVLFQVLAQLGHAWAGNLHHLAYGMVNLPEGKMKSRRGHRRRRRRPAGRAGEHGRRRDPGQGAGGGGRGPRRDRPPDRPRRPALLAAADLAAEGHDLRSEGIALVQRQHGAVPAVHRRAHLQRAAQVRAAQGALRGRDGVGAGCRPARRNGRS